MGLKRKINPLLRLPPLAIATLLVLVAGFLSLAVGGLLSPQASASQHGHETYELDNCVIVERNPDHLPPSRNQARLYQWFYVCQSIQAGGGHVISSWFCIPFVFGSSNYSDYSLPGPVITGQSELLVESRQSVRVFSGSLSDRDGGLTNCSRPGRYVSFKIHCLFELTADSSGPFQPDSLSRCNLEATLANRSFNPAPAVNWGQRHPAGLGPGDSYLVLIDLDNCRQPSGSEPNWRACRLPPITGSTSGDRYTGLDFCWLAFDYDGSEDYPELLERPPSAIGWVEGRPWTANISGFHPVASAGVDGANCTGLRSDQAVEIGVIRYYRFNAFDVRCRINPANPDGTAVSLDTMSRSCLLVGLGHVQGDPGDGVVPGVEPGETFESHLCQGSACGFLETVDNFLRWMTYLVIPLIVIMIIYGGISLSLSGDNPEASRKAKTRITQAIIALVCYALLWSFIKWLL